MNRPRDRRSAIGLLPRMEARPWRDGVPKPATHLMDETWRRYVWGPMKHEPERYTPGAGSTEAGVYFLWHETEDRQTLLYIGKSGNIANRLVQHWKADVIPFNAYSHIETLPELAEFAECAYLFALEPPYNTKFQMTAWRRQERMQKMIARIWRDYARPVC